ncbi:MAG: sigma-54-dependent transcriptional regulator [Myxococcota bacterium]
MTTTSRILVVDDDKAVRAALRVNLSKAGHEVKLAASPAEALKILRAEPHDLVLTDMRMPGGTGLELLNQIRSRWPQVQVVVMTGYGSVDDAVAALKGGASEYLIKPIERDELLVVVDKALEQRALRAEVEQLRSEVQERYGFDRLIGATPVMVSLYQDVAAVADTSANVLLQGPTGTGKELLAHAIHYRSRRAAGPFVRVNCAAIPATLLESELFGHERGAFSGAVRQHQGKFEQSDGGTLLLDEIGEIELSMQVKLLRVLENGEFSRVGGSEALTVDVRVVAATNKDLLAEVRAGRFREDLYYRLNVVRLKVPSLAERQADIPLLLQHFVRKYAERNDRPAPALSRSNVEDLMAYTWPGNVRQLEHAVERAVILNREATLTIPLPDEELRSKPKASDERPLLPPPGVTLQDALAEYEREVIIAALRAGAGVQAEAARRLGLSRSNLNYRIHRLGIQVKNIEYG